MTGMVVLTTERLVLREMTGADLDLIAALFGDEEVMRYYPKPMTRDEARSWVEWNQRLYRSHGFGLWAMVLRDTGEFAGDCGLTPQQVDGKIGLRPEKRATVFGSEQIIYAAAI